LISYEKKNSTTSFIQLLWIEKFKKIYNEKNTKKKRKEKSYLNVVVSEAERKEKKKGE